MMILNQGCSTIQRKNQIEPTLFGVDVYKTGLEKCDKALNACDAALKERELQVEKQAQVIQAQAKELTDLRTDNPLKQPVIWAAVGSGAVALAGVTAIPFLILGVIGIGLLIK